MNSSKLMVRVVDKITEFVKWLALIGIAAFLLLSLLCGIVSCAKAIEKDSEYARQNPWPQRDMRYIEFDGHEYVFIPHDGITHSPKCQCLQKEEP